MVIYYSMLYALTNVLLDGNYKCVSKTLVWVEMSQGKAFHLGRCQKAYVHRKLGKT